MRISEDRYARDLKRLHLAKRLIEHEVRTQWICDWTGLSVNRVRNLFHSYDEHAGHVRRRRGPSPTALTSFLRSPPLRSEASAIGGLAYARGIIAGASDSAAPREASDLETRERWVDTFELYQKIVPQSILKMDQFITLANALAEGQDLQLDHCRNCHGALIVDPLGVCRRLCPACERDSFKKRGGARRRTHNCSETVSGATDTAQENVPVPCQMPLF
jgi:hypothetical protein